MFLKLENVKKKYYQTDLISPFFLKNIFDKP